MSIFHHEANNNIPKTSVRFPTHDYGIIEQKDMLMERQDPQYPKDIERNWNERLKYLSIAYKKKYSKVSSENVLHYSTDNPNILQSYYNFLNKKCGGVMLFDNRSESKADPKIHKPPNYIYLTDQNSAQILENISDNLTDFQKIFYDFKTDRTLTGNCYIFTDDMRLFTKYIEYIKLDLDLPIIHETSKDKLYTAVLRLSQSIILHSKKPPH